VIALFQVALPYELLVLPEDELQLLKYTTDSPVAGTEGFEVLVGPPYRSRLSEADPDGVIPPDFFNPSDPQPVDATIDVGGVSPIRCDAIVVQIVAREFDRRVESSQETMLSLRSVACDATNGLLERLRVLTRAVHLKPLNPENLLYRIVMLDDSGIPVEPEEGKWRQFGTHRFLIRYTAVTAPIWQELVDLGEYETPPWDELLLDAMDLDVELGPSVVLAATAVETRIATALDVLAADKLDSELWTWMNDRNDDFTKTPAVSEQLDQLLGSLGGRSLKDEPDLWEAGVQLRQARNSFVHEGRPLLGRKAKVPVTREKARELVVKAGEIIDFIEGLLPQEQRRPRLVNDVQVSTTVTIAVQQGNPQDDETPGGPVVTPS
jgi:hypothetical protein